MLHVNWQAVLNSRSLHQVVPGLYNVKLHVRESKDRRISPYNSKKAHEFSLAFHLTWYFLCTGFFGRISMMWAKTPSCPIHAPYDIFHIHLMWDPMKCRMLASFNIGNPSAVGSGTVQKCFYSETCCLCSLNWRGRLASEYTECGADWLVNLPAPSQSSHFARTIFRNRKLFRNGSA